MFVRMSALATDPYLHTNGSLSEGCSLPPHLKDDTDAPSLVETCFIYSALPRSKAGEESAPGKSGLSNPVCILKCLHPLSKHNDSRTYDLLQIGFPYLRRRGATFSSRPRTGT